MKELRRKIGEEIRTRGPISFSRYMELCLYDEEFGYYARNASQFGKAGDFYTSSDVHAVFGRLMARQFEEMWRALGSPSQIVVRELGPGRGLFARDVLDWSEKKFPQFSRALQYELVERSAALRERIEDALHDYLTRGTARLESGTATANADLEGGTHGTSELVPLSTKDVPVIVFANEFFDAIPVEVVSTLGSLRIGCHNGRFVEEWAAGSAEELGFLDRYSVHPEEDERLEVPLLARAYMQGALTVEQGFFVMVDYGYTREEQLAGRHRGTVKAIRQHSISADPYEAPGEQDITADVNFTALAAVASELGWSTDKLVTQSQFLLGIGEGNQFADAFEECRLPQERAKVALQLKHLVTPAGMGESFHVLVGGKGVESAGLAGLGFGRK